MSGSPLQQLRRPIENDTSLMTWESLHRRLGPGRQRFARVDQSAYEAMDPAQRTSYNAARIRFMSGEMTVMTRTILDLLRIFTRVESMNSGSLTGRRGVMLSAPASSGKTTACLALIESYLGVYDKENPGAIAGGAVPAVYTSIPATRTVKGVLQRIARFLALPFKKSDTEMELAAMLQEALPAVGTKLIVLDEVQMLSGAESTSRPAVNNLKDLSNYFAGTIVYSGVDLQGSGLLFGVAGNQLTRRVFNVDIIDFTATSQSPEQQAEWTKIVVAFARSLPLYATDPSVIQEEADWLLWFTGGSLGTLRAVMFDAAAMLILNDDPSQETITRGLLEKAVRDYAAERGLQAAPPAPLQGARNRRKIVDDSR